MQATKATFFVIGQKNKSEEKRATFVVLKQRPDSQIIGASIADQVCRMISGKLRRLEDGPIGGNEIRVGEDVVGFVINGTLPDNGSWNLVRMSDVALAQVAYQITANKLVWLPGMTKKSAIEFPISTNEKNRSSRSISYGHQW
jgi:hypothetical protein